MDAEKIKALDEQYVLHTYGRAPFVIERGKGMRLYDTEGKAYLDFVSGIAAVPARDPYVEPVSHHSPGKTGQVAGRGLFCGQGVFLQFGD